MKNRIDWSNKIIKSLIVLCIGIAGVLVGRELLINEEIKRDNYVPKTHNVELSDNSTEFINSTGEYEMWIRVYNMAESQVLNVNFKTDNDQLGDAMYYALVLSDEYDVEFYGSRNDIYGRWLKAVEGVVSDVSSTGGTNFFNNTSTTHEWCVGNKSPYTGRDNSCNTYMDAIRLDYQNVFEFVLSEY